MLNSILHFFILGKKVIEENKVKTFEKVLDSTLHQAYLVTIADVYSRAILDSILDEPKSALEISVDTQIPLRTIYRKIQNMVDDGIVKISGNITESGKKYFMYKSKIRGLHTKYSEKNLEVFVLKN